MENDSDYKHNINGPFYEFSSIKSSNKWFYENKEYSFDEFCKITQGKRENIIYHYFNDLEHKAVFTDDDYNYVGIFSNQEGFHRINGPACKRKDNYTWWYKGSKYNFIQFCIITQGERTKNIYNILENGDKEICQPNGVVYIEQAEKNMTTKESLNDLPIIPNLKLTKFIDGHCYQNELGHFHSENDEPANVKGHCFEWYDDDNLHRINGPAVEYKDFPHNNIWAINGIKYSFEEFIELTKDKRSKTIYKSFVDCSYTSVDPYGNIIKFNGLGKCSCEDGPAIITKNQPYHINDMKNFNIIFSNTKVWIKDGKSHRLDGPAIESPVYNLWFVNDKFHNEQGAAKEYINEPIKNEYWIDGIKYAFEEFIEKTNGKRTKEVIHITLTGKTVVAPNGDVKIYNKEDQLHNDTGPALIKKDNAKFYYNNTLHFISRPGKYWFKNNKLHRIDGPATICDSERKSWYIEGKRHRLDGPAVVDPIKGDEWWYDGEQYSFEEWVIATKDLRKFFIYTKQDGSKIRIDSDNLLMYYNKNDQIHREDGPAKIYPNGDKLWIENDKFHRINGPASITKKFGEEFSYKGCPYKFDEFIKITQGQRTEKIKHTLKDGCYVVADIDGNIEYFDKDEKYHREDGPAVICVKKFQCNAITSLNEICKINKNGFAHFNPSNVYIEHGLFHKEDGPAAIFDDGLKIWWQNGKRHNLHGPAAITPDGKVKWYFEGKEESFESFVAITNGKRTKNIEQIEKNGSKIVARPDGTIIHFNSKGIVDRDDGPAVITGGKYCSDLIKDYSLNSYASFWIKDGKLDRSDGPAAVGKDFETWYKNNKKHRLDGPARKNGGKETWWFEGKEYSFEEFVKITNGLRKTSVRQELDNGCFVIADIHNNLEYFDKEGNYHRENGPALVLVKGEKVIKEKNNTTIVLQADDFDSSVYFKHGQLHSYNDQPVFNSKNGNKEWFNEGVLHRIDGPAKEFADKTLNEWWYEGKKYSFEDFSKITKGLRTCVIIQSLENGNNIRCLSNGVIQYLNKDGNYHRDNRPAIIWPNGDKFYYQYGQSYRDDGPAVETDEYTSWFKNNCYHRIDGPAFISKNKKSWYENGKLHNLNGPAVLYLYDENENKYYIEGKKYTKTAFYNYLQLHFPLKMIEADAKASALRVLSHQSCKLTSQIIANFLKQQGFKANELKSLTSLFSSEYGEALISAALGYGMNAYAPDSPIWETLSKEYRVNAMSVIGNELVEEIINILHKEEENKNILDMILIDTESEQEQIEEEYPLSIATNYL